ncbi:tRNA (adenine(58)-N(1))-methyltransferase catalytic subunit TRM61 [Plasmodium gonderi]|uniref:tRNA (adenine(58)-N(1))-methyltransferase n=1 Tax=Plasmodium gonderi TaxID=77519 RepID=A0A1Y1JTY2_PLAGO|nr:tRNA (adenine(58)-N(1))-methyltransferase catalytic subunit TRM61 [Plasmodium gonderi]GAW83364.1 tRNA (adenine(58)-N(1))-methyltransferase catalytic subunit TRM61 [Plasmodium gonderi]
MHVKENDSVILYTDEENIEIVKLKGEGGFTNKKGTFLHKDIIGKTYGSKIYDCTCKSYIYVLKRTPELIITGLKKKTQTLYEHDISFICLLCNALPNAKIIEAGTGTGCLTYALASCVLPNGIVHTFEYNEERYREVKSEFENFEDIKKNIKFHHKDVINYTFDEFTSGEIDSVFLDMPNPWLCVHNVKNVLKERGTFVIFLPCIEQVYKIIDALEQNKFSEIVTYELINKSWEIIINKRSKQETHSNVHACQAANADLGKDKDFPQQSFLNPVYRLRQKENKTHTGYLTFAKKQLNDEEEQVDIEFKGLLE